MRRTSYGEHANTMVGHNYRWKIQQAHKLMPLASTRISNNSISISYTRGCVNDTIGTSHHRQISTTTNSACTGNNSSNLRTIASYTTHQFVQTSYGTSLTVNSINQRSGTGRSIHVNDGAATDVIIMDGYPLVTSGTVTQQHRHCSTIIGGMLLFTSIGYDMDNPNSVSVSNGWH